MIAAEDTTAALMPQIAAGDALDLWLYAVIGKREPGACLKQSGIDCPCRDLLPYDARGVYTMPDEARRILGALPRTRGEA